MSIDSQSGQITWPVQATQAGSHQVSLQVSDGRGGTATQRFTLVVSAVLLNRPPLVLSSPITTAVPGSNYRYQLTASDPDNQTLQYSLVAGPTGMTIDSLNGLVSYNNAVAGSYPIELNISDGRGGLATQSYRLSVGTVPESAAPRIVSTPPTTATVGALFIYTVSAIDPQRSTLSYALASGPDGMTIDSVTGRISWRPANADLGLKVVRVEARNTLGGTTAQSWSLNVLATAPNTPPSLHRNRY